MIGKILLLLLCLVLVLLIVALMIPAYIRVKYEDETFSASLKYAWVTIPVYPAEQKASQEEPSGEETPAAEKKTSPSKPKPTVNWEQISYSIDTLPSVLLKTLRRIGRRIRIEPLKVHMLVATSDPSDTAVLYGKIQAALAAVLPALHRAVKIREQDIQLFPDFCGEEIDFIVDAGVRIRPGDLLLAALCALGGVLKWYFGFRKRATKPPETKDNNTVDTTAQAETAA